MRTISKEKNKELLKKKQVIVQDGRIKKPITKAAPMDKLIEQIANLVLAVNKKTITPQVAVNVPVQRPPVVNVEIPPEKENLVREWSFQFNRDKDNLIKSINAKAKV